MKKALPLVIALCWVLILFTQQAHAFKGNSSNANTSFNPPIVCPTDIAGYTALGEFDGSKYFISDNTSKWSAAQIAAQANGGYLASITSQEENDFVLANINEIVFIGLNDAQSEGNFSWDNGDPFSFSKFSDTNTSDKDFGKMNFWNGNWGVDDQNVSRRSILEIACDDGGGGGSDCPSDIAGFTTIGEFGDSKYYLSNTTSQPAAAQILAESNGGYLATISSQEENDFIQQHIDIMTFIGLNDVASEGNLEWFNGEALTFDNIDPCGFCEENSESMDYVIMAPWNGTWSFSSQFNSRPFVMEITCDDDGGGGDECSFITTFSTADAGSNLPIASISENTSNSTYEFFTGDVDNTLGGEVVKYPINTTNGQLQNPVSITRAGSIDETQFSTYWDLESNILYLARIVSSDLVLLVARDNQANTLFSKNIDISNINFGETINIKVVNNEIILVGNSGTSNNIPVIKTDIDGNLIWKKELVSNIPDNVSFEILGASKAGGFYLYYDFFGNTVFKISDAGELEWDANVNIDPVSGEFTFLIGEGGDQRFYLKRIKTNPSLSYMAAFDVNTGSLVWDFRAEEAAAAHEAVGATVIGTVITEAVPTLDGGVIMFYTYDVLPPQPVGPPSTVRKIERYDANGNLVWSRDNQLTFSLGRTKFIASDGGFIFADPVNFNSDDWQVVRMNSDGSFEPDCDDVVIVGECGFNTAFSTAAAGPVNIRAFSENTSNSSYELFSKETDNFLSRETNKYSIDATTGELESKTTITRTGTTDESDFQTYWDIESNILYGVKDVSADLLTLWAKDSQGNFIFSKDIDVSDIEFVFPYVSVVHNELILTASSTTNNTFPIIKTDLNGNLIWKKEIPSNVMSGIGIVVHSESKSGGFYLLHEFTNKYIVKVSDDGEQEWVGDINGSDPGEIILVLGESGDGQRFYIKRLSFGFLTRAYLAAFDVSTGNISWDFNAGESYAGGADYDAIIYQVIPANDGGAVVFYYYDLSSNVTPDIYRHERFDINGNLIWERETPDGIPGQLGENKIAASDGSFVVAGEDFQLTDTWRVVKMSSDGYFEPDCGDGGGGDCSTFLPEPIPGFTYQANVGSKYYYLSDDTARPTDAQANCVSNGGHLATVNSQEINDALQPFTNSLVYIGLHDDETEGTLEWRSDASVDFTNFDDCSFCEPNAENRDYAAMQGWNGKWSWSGFYSARRYWLEIDCNSNNTNTLIALPSNEVEKKEEEKLDFPKIVPNPALNHIFVQVKSTSEMPIKVEIYDARGTLLKTQSAELFNGINAIEIDITDLVSGFYFVKIPQLKGASSTQRFVKIRD